MRAWADMLKSAQREDALARGIPLIEWSFDPFEAKNAYFNLERLGAIVRNYVPNMYGITASPLHGDLPTDRCIAEWWISEPRASRLRLPRAFPCPRRKPANRRRRWVASCSGILPMDWL